MEHYFTNNENLKSEIRELNYRYNDIDFKFLSDNGVFAKNKIDYASKLLVETFLSNADMNKEKITILDVGCGYGFIGIVVSKILNAKCELIDINKRALHLCDRNIKLNECDAECYESNIYDSIQGKYDYIITNPPIRAGKDVYMKILKDAKGHLKRHGELWFVISKDQGAKSTKKALSECYNINEVAKSKGFYVFQAKCVDKI